jgi:NAD(P) transhydrogenase subunit beta
MTVQAIANAAYVAAALLFIMSLAGLSKHETGRTGIRYGIAGMAIAMAATIWLAFSGEFSETSFIGLGLLVLAVIIGGVIGVWRAKVVAMTGMPELIALFHSFVGLTAVLVGWNGALHAKEMSAELAAVHSAEVFIGVFIGAITFTGSIVAYLKLSAKMSSKPLILPGRNYINLVALAGFVGLTVAYVIAPDLSLLIAVTVLALALGWHLVASIGGGDMPVVVSMLNSYSGWAAAATGFLLSNNLLIVTGALVGSSGAYLSYIMCKAMNRSFVSVIFGGYGIEAAPQGDEETGEHTEIDAASVAELLSSAKTVVITPGYGMAVAQAQYPVAELAKRLREKGVDVKFGIHPVAGRLPGHMNVLLAEANVPYDQLKEMDEINPEFPSTDVALVVGANDVVNPAARDDKTAPIYGMPILNVDQAQQVVFLKRSMRPGFAGIENELLYDPKTTLLFGDAKASLTKVVSSLKAL